MAADNEKRCYERNDVDSTIMFANYMTTSYSAGKMINCSVDGMYFESDNPVLPTEDICVRRVNLDEDGFGPDCFEGYRAEVKWCKEIGDNDSRYGIGIQFYDILAQ